MTQTLKITVHLVQNFIELDVKEFSDLKALIFGAWGLKTSLGQFGPKAFGKGLIKALVKNPSSYYQKQVLIFSRIMRQIH